MVNGMKHILTTFFLGYHSWELCFAKNFGFCHLESRASWFPEKNVRRQTTRFPRKNLSSEERVLLLLLPGWIPNLSMLYQHWEVLPEAPTLPVKRRRKYGEKEDVDCPQIISAHNKYMSGVNRNDQIKSCYPIKLRTRKWWHRVVFEILDCCVVNSHILEMETSNHENRTYKVFRIELAKKLIGNFSSKKRPGRPSLEMPARLTERHFPSHLPLNEKEK